MWYVHKIWGSKEAKEAGWRREVEDVWKIKERDGEDLREPTHQDDIEITQIQTRDVTFTPFSLKKSSPDREYLINGAGEKLHWTGEIMDTTAAQEASRLVHWGEISLPDKLGCRFDNINQPKRRQQVQNSANGGDTPKKLEPQAVKSHFSHLCLLRLSPIQRGSIMKPNKERGDEEMFQINQTIFPLNAVQMCQM